MLFRSLEKESTMSITQSRFATIKRVTPREPVNVVAPAAAPSLTAGHGKELARMAFTAFASGLVFSLVSGLLIFLVASQSQPDPRDALASAAQQHTHQ